MKKSQSDLSISNWYYDNIWKIIYYVDDKNY